MIQEIAMSNICNQSVYNVNDTLYLSVPKGRGGVYAKAGIKVTITHLHADVAIVEREDGFRFSARVDELTEIWQEPEQLKQEKDEWKLF